MAGGLEAIIESPLLEVIERAQRLLGPNDSTPLSLRGLARAIGVPFETLRAQTLVPAVTARPETVARITEGLTDLLVRARTRLTTRVIDNPIFTRRSLLALQFPPGSQAIKFVYRTTATPSGYGSTEYYDRASLGIEGALRTAGLTPRMVTRVIFDLGS